MISHLTIRNWRAFDAVDLDLGAGTTFVVAANGVGKSSLLEAAAWALYGDVSGVDPVRAIRAGENQCEVALIVETAAGRLRVRRDAVESGATSFDADLDGKPFTDEASYAITVEEAFGASLSVAARLTFLTDKGALTQAAGEFAIRDHLASAFGISELLVGAQVTEDHLEVAASARRKLRKTVGAERKATQSIRADLDTLNAELEKAEATREMASDTFDSIETQVLEQSTWRDYREAVNQHRAAVSTLRAEIQKVPGSVDDDMDPVEKIANSERTTSDALEEARSHSADLKVRATTEAEAAQLLRNAAGVCPTCLRPLEGADLTEAVHHHDDRHQRLVADLTEAQTETQRLQTEFEVWRDLAHNAGTLEAPSPPEIPEPAAEGENVAEVARDNLIEATRNTERLEGQRDKLEEELRLAEERSKVRAEQLIAYRREALTEAAQIMLESVAERYMDDSIHPLTAEVANRWKRLFGGGEGLQLNPDGSIVMNRRGRTLTFEDLSGGERVSALLVTRLLVLTASTDAGFAWLDEPLEHLDPRRRHTLGVTLAKATSGGGIRQILITTYEETLARQLAASSDDVHVLYVKAVPVV